MRPRQMERSRQKMRRFRAGARLRRAAEYARWAKLMTQSNKLYLLVKGEITARGPDCCKRGHIPEQKPIAVKEADYS